MKRGAVGDGGRRRWAWLALAVALGHGLLLWAVADKHFLPKTPYAPPPRPPNFAAREARVVDPKTGQAQVRKDYAVSTRLEPTPPAR